MFFSKNLTQIVLVAVFLARFGSDLLFEPGLVEVGFCHQDERLYRHDHLQDGGGLVVPLLARLSLLGSAESASPRAPSISLPRAPMTSI